MVIKSFALWVVMAFLMAVGAVALVLAVGKLIVKISQKRQIKELEREQALSYLRHIDSQLSFIREQLEKQK